MLEKQKFLLLKRKQQHKVNNLDSELDFMLGSLYYACMFNERRVNLRNVLSLFNGISGLHLALDKSNIQVETVYYSEVDKFANKVTEHHYPNDVALGDVTKWKEWDSESSSNSFTYLRLAQKHIKHKFTPERLLGVETTLGYITTIINERVVMLSRNNVYWYNLNLLKYYISDDSDETVSLDEYIKLFYNTENTL